MLPYAEKARNIHEACGENADQFLELSSTAGSLEVDFTSVFKSSRTYPNYSEFLALQKHSTSHENGVIS